MKTINKILITSAAVVLPFTVQASDLSLGDMYRYIDNSPYDHQVTNTPHKSTTITVGDAYRYESNGAFSRQADGELSGERSEFAVFVNKGGPAIPGYIGEY